MNPRTAKILYNKQRRARSEARCRQDNEQSRAESSDTVRAKTSEE